MSNNVSPLNTDINELIKLGETTQISFLPSNPTSDQIATTLVAMANSIGGHIIIGIKQGEILTVKSPEKICNQIVDIALSLTPKLVMSMPKILEVNKKKCVIAQIPQGLPNVYAYNGHYLKRNDNQNIPITPFNLRQLMLERTEYSYETEIAHNSSLDDLDWVQVEMYINSLSGVSHNNPQEILYQRGCLAKINGKFVPTHAGILLFGKSPQRFIRSSEITAVRFAGDKMGDTFNRQDITGTLPDQIQKVETFLADHLRKSIKLSNKMQREEDYEYPMEAVRELIINAVAHRDYSIQGDNIRLYMYNSHLEVHSPGSLPGPMTLENLKDERFSRNPIVVQILSDMGFIERLGYGVDRVFELMQTQNYNEPLFFNTSHGFKVKLSNKKPNQLDNQVSGNNEESQETLINLNGIYEGKEINPRQESAIIYLHKKTNNRITNSDLKAMFPEVHPETIRRDLVDLVGKNILEKLGQKRGSYYVLLATKDGSNET